MDLSTAPTALFLARRTIGGSDTAHGPTYDGEMLCSPPVNQEHDR